MMEAQNSQDSLPPKSKCSSENCSINNSMSKSSLKSVNLKPEKKSSSEISFKDFLNFLRTAYEINEAVEGVPNEVNNKISLDWQGIAKNEFVSSFMEKKESSQSLDDKLNDKKNTVKQALKQIESVIDTSKHSAGDTNSVVVSPISKKSSTQAKSSESTNESCEIPDDVKAHPTQKDEQKEKAEKTKDKTPNENKCSPSRTSDQQSRSLGAKSLENKRKGITSKKDIVLDCKLKKAGEENGKGLEHVVKRKLGEVIQEGLLDSVLPYVVPKPSANHISLKKAPNLDPKRTPVLDSVEKSSDGQGVSQGSPKEKLAISNRRKSSTAVHGDAEVEIHVCDEVKNMKRDFRCPQKLLVSKMGYFAEVTTGQKLEDMDISVHCDIAIFDWLMRWVKKESLPKETCPALDTVNVVPILVSAAFLQMDPLLQDCLKFCREHMNEIAKTSTNLTCLNDSILSRLANLFSNADVEALVDKKDKIQSRLYCKLIMSLTETSPEPARGHYASLASMYRCGKCEKLVVRQIATQIPCKPASMKMDRFGNIHGNHSRDANWNLNDYIKRLWQSLKSWRLVYWRLWGDCHYLQCDTCKNLLPVNQMHWCSHHPELPQFFTMENQRAMNHPIGRYPCCGSRAYRYEVLQNHMGCKFKKHVPQLNTPRDNDVNSLFTTYETLIALETPQIQALERLTRLVTSKDGEKRETVPKEILWWNGLELTPPRPKQGLLTKLWDMLAKKEEQRHTPSSVEPKNVPVAGYVSYHRPALTYIKPMFRKQMSTQEARSSAESSTGNAESSNDGSTSSSTDSSSSESDDNSEESGHAPVRRVRPKPQQTEPPRSPPHKSKLRRQLSGRWVAKHTIRSNQDNQREYEEWLGKQMSKFLTRKTCGDSTALYARTHGRHHHHGSSIWNSHIVPQGGVYVRMEHEWREARNHAQSCHSSNTTRSRAVSGVSSAVRPRVRTGR